MADKKPVKKGKPKPKPKPKPKEAEAPVPVGATPAPRQARLPGVEDPVITEIEGLAEEWADHDKAVRIAREQRDVTLNRLLSVMHANHRSRYKRDGIEITVTPHDEKVRVKYSKPKESGTQVDMSA